MSNTIFTVELPFVKTEKELEKIKRMYPKYDPYFITSGCSKKMKNKFDKLWGKYQPYADSDFLIQLKIKLNFYHRIWEMYVGNVFLKKKLEIQKIKPQNEGPDFVIEKTAYIECVAPTKGDLTKADSVPEMFVARTLKEKSDHDVPVDKIILRITQVIQNKALGQYQKWKSKSWFEAEMPFIIAVNTGDLGYLEDPNMPNVLKALFGFQFMQINMKTGATNYSHRNSIAKSSNNLVPVNYFINTDFKFVSGVLFSNESVLRYPDNIGDDCLFVNNPFADNPVGESFIKFFKSWIASKNNDRISLKKNY